MLCSAIAVERIDVAIWYSVPDYSLNFCQLNELFMRFANLWFTDLVIMFLSQSRDQVDEISGASDIRSDRTNIEIHIKKTLILQQTRIEPNAAFICCFDSAMLAVAHGNRRLRRMSSNASYHLSSEEQRG